MRIRFIEHACMALNNREESILSNRTKDGKANLTTITWAHAVNSQARLNEALKSNVEMIEADIVLGTVNNTGAEMPVMSHPPATDSDISLEEFLNQIMRHNAQHENKMKGVKLDFKSIEVFEGSLDILNEKLPSMKNPIWLNADIIQGPVNETMTIPVNPERFFAGSKPFEKAVLSIGWTTNWGENFTDGEYTKQEIDNMLAAIKSSNVTARGQSITFPVRAGIAANSKDQLQYLLEALKDTNESSLTIWSAEKDYVDVEKIRDLIHSIGVHRVYLDVPNDLNRKLNLKGVCSKSCSSVLPTLMNLSVLSGFVVAVCFFLLRKNI